MPFADVVEHQRLDLLTTGELNYLIKNNGIDTNGISDGYHTFGELYAHRIELWIAFLKSLAPTANPDEIVWRSKANDKGEVWEGWFLLGRSYTPGKQISYHLPIDRWEECDFAEELEQAPPFDGHTSNDVLERLKNI